MFIYTKILQESQLKVMNFKFLKNYCDILQLLLYINDDEFFTKPALFKDDCDIRNIPFIISNHKKIGTGFTFQLDDNFNIHLRLFIPCSKLDIGTYFDFIKDFCTKFQFPQFIQEDKTYTVDDIEDLKQYCYEYHRQYLISLLEENNLVIGVGSPIYIERKLIDDLKQFDGDHAHTLYENYLNRLQNNPSYYAAPKVFEDSNKSDTYHAYYTIYFNETAIIPKQVYLPFWYDNLKIKKWKIELAVSNYQNTYKPIKTLHYQDFLNLLTDKNTPSYDERNYLFHFGKKQLETLMKDEIFFYGTKIKEILKINKVTYLDVLRYDLDLYYVFSYKKSLFSKPLIAIYYKNQCIAHDIEYRKDHLEKDTYLVVAQYIKNKLF